MYKISFFVPEEYADRVKQALFDAGAGRLGDYDCCAWQTQGTGQFRPLPGSRPFIGQQGLLEKVAELKVELICADEHIKAAVAALRQAHPYQEPALEVWKMDTF